MQSPSRNEIHPLCDKHYRPMLPEAADGSTKLGKGSKLSLYRCSVEGCTRHYDSRNGYFGVISGNILADKYGKKACPNDKAALYLESYDNQGQEETWCCPDPKCKSRSKKSTKIPEFLSLS